MKHRRAVELAAAPEADTSLDEIWWRGKQWAVTSHGIELLDGNYDIDADRLAEGFPEATSDGKLFYEETWPVHMAEKTWIDIDEFITAWLVALALHETDADPLNPTDIRNVVARAKIENERNG